MTKKFPIYFKLIIFVQNPKQKSQNKIKKNLSKLDNMNMTNISKTIEYFKKFNSIKVK